jgi:lysine-N-methylase
VRGDLPAGALVVALPEAIEIGAGTTVPREAAVRWSRAALRAPGSIDAVGLLWSLAAKVERGDLSEDGVEAAIASPSPPDEDALAPWIEALAARTAAKREAAERWRSDRDRVRTASRVLAAAAAALQDRATLGTALAGVGAPWPLEAFYVTAALHGHALLGEIPLAHALRDRAVRLVLARAVPVSCAEPGLDVSYPLPLVEAMMRAQGVKEYARMVT